MDNNSLQKGQRVFALDIGTRSVIGLVGSYSDNKIVIQETAIAFHQDRVMMDGQIHDIEGVVEIVTRVKRELEEKTGSQLKEVAIAAAGRALKTHRLSVERDIEEIKPIDKYLVNSLEIEALQIAQMYLEEQSIDNSNYFCVGHTIVNYYLNDSLILNPIGHRGNKLKVDLIATFLPHLVVDSLNTVMSKIGLEVSYMTLEPIAAIEVAVPKNVRLLNVALVDIGAGTSDIAITKDGSIVAYAMTSTAGDEITEALSKAFLLDFDSAERIKCNLRNEEYQQIVDIVGIAQELRTEDILDQINPSIELVAKEIAESIIKQNDKAPSAVFLIGGGSQIPRLPEAVARLLNMHKERVVVRGVEIIQNLKQDNLVIKGPEGITPIGILAKAIENNSKDFVKLYINGKEIKLFQSKQLKVIDALVSIGFNPRELIPKRGKAISVNINNKLKNYSGEYGVTAEIFVNYEKSSLETIVNSGDIIDIHPAQEGKTAVVTIKDIINTDKHVYCNNKRMPIYSSIRVNDQEVSNEYMLKDGDQISYLEILNIADICNSLSIKVEKYNWFINGKIVGLETLLENKDDIAYLERIVDQETSATNEVGRRGSELLVNYNGNPIKIANNNKDLLFVDIFNYIEFDVSTVRGRLVLLLNGFPANYTDIIQEGDDIVIKWE